MLPHASAVPGVERWGWGVPHFCPKKEGFKGSTVWHQCQVSAVGGGGDTRLGMFIEVFWEKPRDQAEERGETVAECVYFPVQDGGEHTLTKRESHSLERVSLTGRQCH
ncbi:hypothetical protein FKM82_029181 [Ascaphus truei]